MHATCLRAIAYARDYGEFRRARDLLADFPVYNAADQRDLDYALDRVDELEDRAVQGGAP